MIGPMGKEMLVLKPADARIPHPHLIAHEKDKLNPDLKGDARERDRRYYERIAADEAARAQAKEKKAAMMEAKKTRVQSDRWEWVVSDVQATAVGTGKDGRGTKSVGERYGVPSQDRKRGQVKIPTRVLV
jgi:hypothetical protein